MARDRLITTIFCGLDFPDLGFCARDKIHWAEESAADRPQHHGQQWWGAPWHQVPAVRHAWGEVQTSLHPGTQEVLPLRAATLLRRHAASPNPPLLA